MKPFSLSPLHQVEYAVLDLAFTQRFFTEVLGESEVETRFSAALTNPALDIRHAGFGATVQQFCQPLMEGLPHYDALQAHGPCVHNLCYLVDRIDNIVANCRHAGFDVLIEFPLTDIWRSVLDEENIHGNHQSYIMNTQALFGFQLELAQTPWIEEPQPPLMLPAHGQQWIAEGASSGNTLRALNVVVEDLDATLSSLEQVFGDNLLTLQTPHVSDDGSERLMAVELGKVALIYHQPVAQDSELAVFLAQRGPAVHSLVAESRDLGTLLARLRDTAIDYVDAPRNLTSVVFGAPAAKLPSGAVHVQSLAQVGVHFILLPAAE